MFKIFEEPERLHVFDVRTRYPNKAFIIINYEKDDRFEGTVIGEVYAISDDAVDSLDMYNKEIRRLLDSNIVPYIGNTFNEDSTIE